MYNYASIQDVNEVLDMETVACGITLGDQTSTEVFEYDSNFSSSYSMEENEAAIVNNN